MKTILVIEDNQDVRENLVEILELANYKTLSAANGKVGAQLAKSEKPDLILCDVMMPELDGFGVLRILSADANTCDIPFIFLTAKVGKDDFRKGMGLGADDYITKPFDDVELLDAIEMRLSKSERLQPTSRDSLADLRSFFSEAKANEALQNLAEDREVRTYYIKDPIYEEDRVPRWLFYLVAGKVKVIKRSDYGKELIIRQVGAGEFLGHNALIREDRYTDTAVAQEACEIKLIPKSDFIQLLYNQRDFAAQFVKMLAHEVRIAEQHLIDQAYGSVRRKVAQALLQLSSTDNPIIHSSRDDLAALAGVAKETLIRTLSDFKKEQLIKSEANNIAILDHDALCRIPQ